MRRALLVLGVLAVAGLAGGAAAATNPYTLGGPKSEVSAWPTPAAGFTFGGGAGSVSEKYQTSAYSGGKPNTTEFTWKLPSSIPEEGAKGSITISATAGSEVWAPGFGINGVLVGCSGITNTPSYGTGCAEGDHAAVGVSLDPGQSKTVTQDFLIKPGIGTVTVVIPGFAQQFVYTSAAAKTGATPSPTTTTDNRFTLVRYAMKGTYSHPHRRGGTVLGMTMQTSGHFEVQKGQSDFATGNAAKGTMVVVLMRTTGNNTLEFTEASSEYLAAHGSQPASLRIYFTVTKSTLPCLAVGKTVRVVAEDRGAGGSDLISFAICGLHPIGFDQTDSTVVSKAT